MKTKIQQILEELSLNEEINIVQAYRFFLDSKIGRDIVSLFANNDYSDRKMDDMLQDYFEKWYDRVDSAKALGSLMRFMLRDLRIKDVYKYGRYDAPPLGDFVDDVVEKIIPLYKFYIKNRNPEEEKRFLDR